MEWYRIASKPPAYLVERLSDIQYATDLARTSPSNARLIVDQIVNQLTSHMDHEYVDDFN